jgi:aryl-alcohol dehydrogenase-like predicted oxidoreductase
MVHPITPINMIHSALCLGVRLVDTGPCSGAGDAERRLGEAMLRLPRLACIVTTKAGITSAGLARRIRDFSPEGIRKSVEASLRRLGMRRIDWLFLHGPSQSDLTDDLLKALDDMKRNGDVAILGVAGRGAELDTALATEQFGAFMLPVHAALKPHELERLARLKDSGAEIVGIETLAPALPRFPKPVTPGATWRLARALMGRSGPAPPTPMTVEECLAWALGEGGCHRVVATTTRPEHLEANVYAVSTPSSGRLIAGSSGPS